LEEFFLSSEDVVYCNNADDFFGALGGVHNTEEWRLFVDLSNVSLKAVRLHNGNIHPSVPLAFSVHMKGSHENMRNLLGCIDCDSCRWKIWGDLNVLGLLLQLIQSNAHSLIKIKRTLQVQ